MSLPEIKEKLVAGVGFDVDDLVTGFGHDQFKMYIRGFPGGAVVENLPANAWDTGSSPGLGRSHVPRSN